MAGQMGRLIARAAMKLAGPGAFSELGVGGSAMYGGYPQADPIKPQMSGVVRWRKAHELLADVSIIAASVRYFLNLTARPAWKANPPNDKPEAKAVAEFIDSVIQGCDTSWARMVRRQGTYRFHGFGFHEWVAKRRDDGKIGLAKIEPRPGHTIERWELDGSQTVTGVWQRAPQTGQAIFLPRAKLVYLVDDMLSDDPQGLGWFRHLLEPAELLREYLKLEKVGFARDLSGIPIGRAPISAINSKIGSSLADGTTFTKEMADEMIKGLRDFVMLKSKQPDTGLLLDSQPFTGQTTDGKSVSTVMQWGLELLTGQSTSIDKLGHAIKRLEFTMSLIMGTENLLVGREGEGSRALSEDKSRNLYMNVNSTLGEMAESHNRDTIGPICALNGIPDELRPELKVEDAAFKDVQQIASTLKDMAAAGAVLAPDDPAIDDVRDLLGMEHAIPLSPEMLGMVRGKPKPNDPSGGSKTNDPTTTGRDAGK